MVDTGDVVMYAHLVTYGHLVSSVNGSESWMESSKPPCRRRSRGEKRSEVTKGALLNAASEIFAEKGMDLTTIDNITERANLGKGTFYYYFDNKNDIIELSGYLVVS